MADPIQLDPKPITADPYVDEAKNQLTSLRDGLKTNLPAYPQIPTISDFRKQMGDIDKPIANFDDLVNKQSTVRKQEENLSLAEQGLKQYIGTLESQYEQEKRIIDVQSKKFAAEKANEIRRGQDAILKEMEDANNKELHFTQENVQSIATLFSLLGVISIGGGKDSKMSAMNTMSAMTGMLKGYQQGRADLWRREKEEFEKNMAKTKAKLETYSKKAELAWKTMPYDIEKANSMMSELVAQVGSQIVKAKFDLQGIPETAKYLNNLYTGFGDQFDKFMKQRTEDRAGREETRKIDKDKADKDFREIEFEDKKVHERVMENFRQQEIDIQKNKAAAGALKPTGEVTKNYIGEAQLAADLKNLKDKLKDPELRKMVEKYRFESFLSEAGGKVGNQLLQTEIPEKLQKFISQAQTIRNNVYLTNSGKAVTTSEAMRSYGTVPQPGDTVKTLEGKIDVLRKGIAGRQAITRRLYGALPDLSDAPASDGSFDVNKLQVETESAPAIPEGVPPSAQYSPSQKTWWWTDSNNKWQSKKVE